jgi:predicted ATPase
MYLRSIQKKTDFPLIDQFPFNVKALVGTQRLDFTNPVTFFVGENGSGKSALMDAIARKGRLLPWGGSKVHRVHANPHETRLANHLDLEWSARHNYGFHFRAEAFFNFASSLDDILMDDPGRTDYFGGRSLNTFSHGESFLAFFAGRSFNLPGLYLLDEPEAALSPRNQIEFLRIIVNALRDNNKQYIIATHSPIILRCPDSVIMNFDKEGIRPISYEQSPQLNFYLDFLNCPERFLKFNV